MFRYIVLNPINQKTRFKLRNINLIANSFELNLYDENIQKKFLVSTDKIRVFASEYKKPIKITTKGVIKSSNHKISDFDLNLSVKLDENSAGKFRQKFFNLSYNPFYYADKYKFYICIYKCYNVISYLLPLISSSLFFWCFL